MGSIETKKELIQKIEGLENELASLKETQQSHKKERDFIYEVLYWTDSLIVVIDLKGYIITFNRSSERLSGYLFEEVRHKPFWDILIPADERDAVKSAITDVIEKGLPDKFQNHWVTKDGAKRFITWVNSILKNPDGTIEYILCTGRDITDQRNAEKALRKSEEKYRELVQYANSIILRVNKQGRITFINEFAQAFFGFKEDEILGRKVFGNIIPAIDSSGRDLKAMFKDLFRTPSDYLNNENENIKRDGERVWVSWTNRPIFDKEGKISEILCVGNDITDRKLGETAIIKSEEKFRNIVNSSPMGIHLYRLEPDGRLIFTGTNPAADHILGVDNTQFIGKTIEEAFPALAETEIPERYRNTCAKGERWRTEQIKYEDDQIKGAFEVHAFQTSQSQMAAMFFDITERKTADETLRESEERFRVLFEHAPYPSYITTIEGTLVDGNRAAEKLTGFKKDELIGKNFAEMELLSEEDTEKALRLLEKNQKGQPTGPDEFTLYRKNGEAVFTRIITLPVSVKGEKLVLGIARDITEHKKAAEEKELIEAQLRQAQKMEAIGTLAGGIAHDFNNILSAIMGYTELALVKASEAGDLEGDLHAVYDASLRARDLVKQILTFSRQAEQDTKPVQVSLIVKEALKFLRSSLPSSIEICQSLTSNARVLADPTQVHQVLMNLCSNAMHAMRENGGVLNVSLQEVQLEDDFAAGHPEAESGNYLKLTVADSGGGMPEKVLDKIFDPFFTTKGKEEGTGLGLAVVHGIVKSCNGFITASSEIGKGSVFNVFFPVIESRKPTKISVIDNFLPTGSERVLLVDDEKVLTDIVKQMLESYGYRVTTRTSSIEALELFKAQPDQFDLVITDLTMPNMSGLDLASEIIALRPKLPIILCTGFSDRITSARSEAVGIKSLIMKPVLRDDLIHMTRKVLDESK